MEVYWWATENFTYWTIRGSGPTRGVMKVGCLADMDRLWAVKRSVKVCCAERLRPLGMNMNKTNATEIGNGRFMLTCSVFSNRRIPGAVTFGTRVCLIHRWFW